LDCKEIKPVHPNGNQKFMLNLRWKKFQRKLHNWSDQKVLIGMENSMWSTKILKVYMPRCHNTLAIGILQATIPLQVATQS